MTKNILFFLCFLWSVLAICQKERKDRSKLRPQLISLYYGYGNEDNFLFNDPDYFLESKLVKVSFYYPLNHKKYQLGLSIQPQIHFLKHQLLNEFFIQPNEPNFEALRTEFTQLKQLKLYAIQGELSFKKRITKSLDLSAFFSIGPAIIDTETERLSKGFTFIENLGLSIDYKIAKQWFLAVKPSYAHISNAQLQQRNSGYNSLNIEFGIGFQL